MKTEEIREKLFELQDLGYREFHSALMPTVDPQRIIGVRTPALRKLAKEIGIDEEFMSDLPHEFYEEDNLHAFMIEQIKDRETCAEAIDAFLPYVDNWATCDLMRPAVLKKNPWPERWMNSESTYVCRYGIGQMMYMPFTAENMERVAEIKSDEYYVNMMIAWYFATALSYNYEEAAAFISGNRLDIWTHNKAIQKAVESRRVSAENKEKLKKLRK